MSKKGVSAISGIINPIIGENCTYKVASWYPDTPNSKRDLSKVIWELFKKRDNGKFTTTNIKKTGIGNFTFGQIALGDTYRLEGYIDHPEGGGLIIKPQTDRIPRITKVELFYVDDTKGSTFSFKEKLRAKADCVNMLNKELVFTLWEDDAKDSGHNKNNKPIATKTKKVNKNGEAVVEFILIEALMRKAREGEADIKQLEFYVTVEYYVHKKHPTNNININNPFPTEPNVPQTPPRRETQPPPPQAPTNPIPPSPTQSSGNSEPLPVPKADGSPAEQKPPSRKEESGIQDEITEGKKYLWDWGEAIAKAIRDKLPTVSPPEAAGTASVKSNNVEALLDAYFAKEEFTKETNESAGNYTYNFLKDNARVNKDEIAGIIKGKIEGSLKAEKKYVKLNDIKNALPSSYTKGSSISFATYKLGTAYKKITNAPLEDDVFVVAQTMKLDGKQVTIQIKEKETLLVGASGNVSVLEAKENGNELTELKAIAQDGIAKVKIKLRPKSDEDLKKWKEKLQGIKDGTHTYTFGGNNDTSTEAQKKSIAQVIVNKVKQQLAGSNKFAKTEDIAKVLTKTSYIKDEQVTFDVYKTITEQWWLKAECTGEKKHEGEFLKKEGAYFTICKKCECEARIRAFMRVLRVAEGTGEYKKGTKEARDPQLGYTTWFSGGGNNFVLSDDHPRVINSNSTNSLRSSAAGAYQFMSWKFDELNGYEIIFKDGYFQTKIPKVYTEDTDKAKKYNAKGFNKIAQDRLCVIILKDIGVITKLLNNDIRGAISSAAGTWVSLPGGTTGQPTAKMQDTLDYYNEFLKEELSGKSHLHIQKGFLKEFNITCQCQQQEESNGICPDDCSQCFDYADVWKNPEISSDNGGKNNNRYGYNSTRGHKGIDILTGPTYKDVHSIMCGEVVSLVDSFKTNEYRTSSLRNTLMIKSKTKKGETVFILYCHLDRIYVKKGDKVKHGQKVALSGSTGNASYSGLPNGVSGRGIDKSNWHCHIEAATRGDGYNNFLSLGSYRVKAEDYMKTKFNQNGNAIK